jgi:polyferredoxin
MNINILLADIILFTHAAFIVFVVLGQLLIVMGWQCRWAWPCNPVFRGIHLLAIGIVVLQAWCGLACPLTLLEHNLRQAAGEAGYQVGFISDWLHRLFFYRAPLWVFTLAYTLFGLLVLFTWWVYPPRKKRQPALLSGDHH